ncbi:MAG: hypothetical protein CMJ31_05300 [Phycisphaerae bacterium]|nr:hypothetical protein [Phycisphaerae bacterium]
MIIFSSDIAGVNGQMTLDAGLSTQINATNFAIAGGNPVFLSDVQFNGSGELRFDNVTPVLGANTLSATQASATLAFEQSRSIVVGDTTADAGDAEFSTALLESFSGFSSILFQAIGAGDTVTLLNEASGDLRDFLAAGGGVDLRLISDQSDVFIDSNAIDATYTLANLDVNAGGRVVFRENVIGLDGTSTLSGVGGIEIETPNEFAFSGGTPTFENDVAAAGSLRFVDVTPTINNASIVSVSDNLAFQETASTGFGDGEPFTVAFIDDNFTFGSLEFRSTTGDVSVVNDGADALLNFLATENGGVDLRLIADAGSIDFDSMTADTTFTLADLTVDAFTSILFSSSIDGVTLTNGALVLNVDDASGAMADQLIRVNGANSGTGDFTILANGIVIDDQLTAASGVNLVLDGGAGGVDVDGLIHTEMGDLTFASDADVSAGLLVNGDLAFEGQLLVGGGMGMGADFVFDVSGLPGFGVTAGDIMSGPMLNSLTILSDGGTVTLGSFGFGANRPSRLEIDTTINGGVGSIVFRAPAVRSPMLPAGETTIVGYDADELVFRSGAYATMNASRFGDGFGTRGDFGTTTLITFAPTGSLTLGGEMSAFARGGGAQIALPNIAAGGFDIDAQSNGILSLQSVANVGELLSAANDLRLNGAITGSVFDAVTYDLARRLVIGQADAAASDLQQAELNRLSGVGNVFVGSEANVAELRLFSSTLRSLNAFTLRGDSVFSGSNTVTLATDLFVAGDATFESGLAGLRTTLIGDGAARDVTFNQGVQGGNFTVLDTFGGDWTTLGAAIFGSDLQLRTRGGDIRFAQAATFGSTIAIDSEGGAQLFEGPLTVGNNAAFSSEGGEIDIAQSFTIGDGTLIDSDGGQVFVRGDTLAGGALATLEIDATDGGADGSILIDDILLAGAAGSTVSLSGLDILFTGSAYETSGEQSYTASRSGAASYATVQAAAFDVDGAGAALTFADDAGQQFLASGGSLSFSTNGGAIVLPVMATLTNGTPNLAVNGGAVTLGTVGSAALRYNSVNIGGSILNLSGAFTTGSQNFNGSTQANLGSGGVYSALGGSAIAFAGPVSINGGTQVLLGSGGSATFGGTVQLLSDLVINSGGAAATATFGGDIAGAGGAVSPFSLSVLVGPTGVINLGGTRVAAGSQAYQAGTYNIPAVGLYSLIANAGAGVIDFAPGNLSLGGANLLAEAMGAGSRIDLPTLLGSLARSVTIRSNGAASIDGGMTGQGIGVLDVSSNTFALGAALPVRDALFTSFDTARDIALGDFVDGALHLSQADLDNLVASGGAGDRLIIGGAMFDGGVFVSDAQIGRETSFETGGAFELRDGGLRMANGADVSIDADSILLAGNATGAGGAFDFIASANSVNAAGESAIRTGGGRLEIASVDGEINGRTAGEGDLELNAGAGVLDAGTSFGATRELGSLRLVGSGSQTIDTARTAGSQTYDINVNASGLFEVTGEGGSVAFNRNFALADDTMILLAGPSAASSVAFSSPIAGDGSLIIDVAGGMGTIRLGGDVNVTDTFSANGRLLLPASRSIMASMIELLGGARSLEGAEADLTLMSSGQTRLAGDFGAAGRLGGLLVDAGSLELGDSSFLLADGATINAPTTVTGEARIQTFAASRSGSIVFDSTIDGTAGSKLYLITDRSLGRLVNGLPDTTTPIIAIRGDINGLDTIGFNFDEAGIDGRDFVPASATIVLGDPDSLQGSLQTIDVNVGSFLMGAREKLVALGSLNLDATSAATARLGDMVALGDLIVNSPSIVILAREPGQLFDISSGMVIEDGGTDFVAGGRIQFNTITQVISLSPAAGAPRFALPSGDALVGSGSGFFQVFALTEDLGGLVRFNRAGELTVLDIRVDGPSNTNVSEALAGATPRQDVPPPTIQIPELDESVQTALLDLGIRVREQPEDEECVTGPQTLSFSTGRSNILYDLACDPSLLDSGVVISPQRINADEVESVILAYNALFGDEAAKDGVPGEYAFDDALVAVADSDAYLDRYYAEVESETFDARHFLDYILSVETPETLEARAYLARLNRLLVSLRGIGLTEGELPRVHGRIASIFTGRGMQRSDYEAIIKELSGRQNVAFDLGEPEQDDAEPTADGVRQTASAMPATADERSSLDLAVDRMLWPASR